MEGDPLPPTRLCQQVWPFQNRGDTCLSNHTALAVGNTAAPVFLSSVNSNSKVGKLRGITLAICIVPTLGPSGQETFSCPPELWSWFCTKKETENKLWFNLLFLVWVIVNQCGSLLRRSTMGGERDLFPAPLPQVGSPGEGSALLRRERRKRKMCWCLQPHFSLVQ